MPAGLLADLLANLGIALWTGGVLVIFVQILPEARPFEGGYAGGLVIQSALNRPGRPLQ